MKGCLASLILSGLIGAGLMGLAPAAGASQTTAGPAPAPGREGPPAAAGPVVAGYRVDAPPAAAIDEMRRRLALGDVLQAFPGVFPFSDEERGRILAARREAQQALDAGQYAAAWRRITGWECQKISGIKSVAFGDLRYVSQNFSVCGVLWRNQLALAGLDLKVTCLNKERQIIFYKSGGGWDPPALGAKTDEAQAVYSWGPGLRFGAFPFTLRTSVSADSVVWQFRCATPPNALRRYPDWFALAFRGEGEWLWQHPASLVDLDRRRTDLDLPALSAGSNAWNRVFSRISEVVFHQPEADVSVAVAPAVHDAKGYTGLTVAGDRATRRWTFAVDWTIPPDVPPALYQADFDLKLQFTNRSRARK